MSTIRYSVEVEGMDIDSLPLRGLQAIAYTEKTTAMGGQIVRITAVTRAQLFHYIVEHWGDVDYAAQVVYGNYNRRPLTIWDIVR